MSRKAGYQLLTKKNPMYDTFMIFHPPESAVLIHESVFHPILKICINNLLTFA